MEKIKAFFENYSIKAHSVAAAIAFLILAYGAVPKFHDLVLHINSLLPSFLSELLAAAVALYVWYKNNVSDKALLKIALAKQGEQLNAVQQTEPRNY